jgi:hypothetical protein
MSEPTKLITLSSAERLTALLEAWTAVNLLRRKVEDCNTLLAATVREVGTGVFAGDEIYGLSLSELDDTRERLATAIGNVVKPEDVAVIEHSVPCSTCHNRVGIQSRGVNTVLRALCPRCLKPDGAPE